MQAWLGQPAQLQADAKTSAACCHAHAPRPAGVRQRQRPAPARGAAACTPRRWQRGWQRPPGRHAWEVSCFQGQSTLQDASVSVILLAGGVGKRMGAKMPKQYMSLRGQPIATHSLDVFAHMQEVGEIVVVCEPAYRHLFEDHWREKLQQCRPHLVFALPGIERQDSVLSGLKAIRDTAELVAIHDSARPLITAEDTQRCLHDGLQVGAAVLGVAVKPTIKQVDSNGQVVRTLSRSSLWEVQTPQVVRPALLRRGFEHVAANKLEVTDDVSIIEALGLPVRITPGSYTNIKVTTPDDMVLARILTSGGEGQDALKEAIAASQDTRVEGFSNGAGQGPDILEVALGKAAAAR